MRRATLILGLIAGPIVGLLGVLSAGPAAAQSPTSLGEFNAWGAFKVEEAGGSTCYLASKPERSDYSQPISSRGDVWLMVTHRPKRQTENEVSVLAGYAYKPQSRVGVDIDGRKYQLYPDGDVAWTTAEKDDLTLVRAMRRGARMIVTGTSKRGTTTEDTFSLRGFTKAHNAASKACGVRAR